MKKRVSEIDETHVIDENKWVLTMARKTTGSHQQHTFLIVEGIQNDQAVTWFMDLVGPGMSVLLPNILDSRIRMEHYQEQSEAELKSNPMIYRCDKRMMDLRPQDGIAEQHWYIDQEDALRLIQSINKDKEHPPVFNILGIKSVITSASAQSSSKEKGHNCFTYAREKIVSLKLPQIVIDCDNSAYYIEQVAGVSSLTLRDKRQNPRVFCPNYKTILAAGAVAAVASVAAVAARSYYSPQ